MSNCSTCPTPLVARKKFMTEDDEVLQNPTVFRRLIGALQYVTNTRPNIIFSMNKLSRYLNKPNVKHWQVAKHILRYLKGTSDHGIHLKPSSYLTGGCPLRIGGLF